MSIFHSPQGEAIMERWYQHFLAALPFPATSRTVPTGLGDSHVLVTGPDTAAPFVLFHGAMSGAPHALSQMGDFPQQHRVYAVDIPGQSVRGPKVRPDPEATGRWVIEVLDGLGLDRAVLCGASWGGYVALRGAIAAPERASGLFLAVPASLVKAPVWPQLRDMGIPLMLYKLMPTPARRDRMLAGQFTTHDPMWAAFIADAMRYMVLDFSVPPLVTDDDLAKLTAPVGIMAADRDVSFPGEQLLERARSLFPNLVVAELVADSNHIPAFDGSFTPSFVAAMTRLADAAAAFSAT